MSDLYEADIAAWAEQQADALHRRATSEIDWENLAEEIESLAGRDRRQIRNRLAVHPALTLDYPLVRAPRQPTQLFRLRP